MASADKRALLENAVRTTVTTLSAAGVVSTEEAVAFLRGIGGQPYGGDVWVTRREAAGRLKVTTRTIDRMVAGGLLTAHHLGPRLVRFAQREVDSLPRREDGAEHGRAKVLNNS